MNATSKTEVTMVLTHIHEEYSPQHGNSRDSYTGRPEDLSWCRSTCLTEAINSMLMTGAVGVRVTAGDSVWELYNRYR